jgi:hypothetical protein
MSYFDPTDHETNKKILDREWIKTNKKLIKNMREIIKNPNTPPKNRELAEGLLVMYVNEIKLLEGKT